MPMILTQEAYEEVLRTAAFGVVRLGAAGTAVVSALGSPEEVGQGISRMTILAYDSKHLQVTLKAHKVVHFGLYFRKEDPAVLLSNLTLSARTTPIDLLTWMRDAGIGWTERTMPDGLQTCFSNGLVAVFQDGTLESLQVS